jgi:hypothetical protein
LHDIDVGYVTDPMEEHDVIYAAVDGIHLVPQALYVPLQHDLDLLDFLGTLRGQPVRQKCRKDPQCQRAVQQTKRTPHRTNSYRKRGVNV